MGFKIMLYGSPSLFFMLMRLSGGYHRSNINLRFINYIHNTYIDHLSLVSDVVNFIEHYPEKLVARNINHDCWCTAFGFPDVDDHI